MVIKFNSKTLITIRFKYFFNLLLKINVSKQRNKTFLR